MSTEHDMTSLQVSASTTHIPHFFGNKMEVFPFQNNAKKSRSILQDGSKCLELFCEGISHSVAEFQRTDVHIFGHSSDEKTLFSSQLTLLHSERPKLYTILTFLSATGLYMGYPKTGAVLYSLV